MEKFIYDIPTRVIFGSNILDRLPKELKRYGANRILITYGKNSIKKYGLYDKVINLLDENGFYYKELSGIKPNPDVQSVREGVKIIRENNLDFILAIGGGSTIDCSKAISAATGYTGDPWDMIIEKPFIKEVIPIGSILTIAATGSEMNGNAVISNVETEEKVAIAQPNLCPKFAFEDPEITYTLPALQTASGATDIFVHLLEQYFDSHEDIAVTDRMIEGVMKSVIENSVKALEEPDNFEARGNLMWASSLALNKLFFCGKKFGGDWASHAIEHEISAIYDIPHGVGLAIVTPNFLKFILEKDLKEGQPLTKFLNFAENVFNVTDNDKEIVAREGIEQFQNWLKSMNIATTLSELEIDDSRIAEMAQKTIRYKPAGKYYKLSTDDIETILKNSI